MGHSEVIETRGTLRVRLVLDEGPAEPYDDGGSPIVRWAKRGQWGTEQITVITSYVLDERVIEAARRLGPEGDTFQRYLRIFHGTTCYVEYDQRDSGFVYATFDTAHWRQAMGLTDEHLAAHPEIRDRLANMDEYKAWCEGEVYGWVVERETTWRKDGDPDTTMTTWEEVDSCWGYYGHEDGERAAREALADQVKSDEAESTSQEPQEQIAMPAVPEDFPVAVLMAGDAAANLMTCGTCGRSWDDAIPTEWTPAPSGRCPFEDYH